MAQINNPQSSSMAGGGRRRGDFPLAVTKRRVIWPHWWRSLMIRRIVSELSMTTKIGVQLAIIFWSAWGFKQFEPLLFPVVQDFKIEKIKDDDKSVMIAGTMEKIRDCRFEEVVAYSNQHLINLEFSETTHIVSRVQGEQSWGWWSLTPAPNRLKLYAVHDCWSGHVTTKLYDGDLPR